MNTRIEIDKLALLLNSEIVVNDFITIRQPSIGDILEYGEKQYFNMIQTLCCIPSDMKSKLWDSGKDWNKISDFELFVTHLYQSCSLEQTQIILGNLDLKKFCSNTINVNGTDILILFNSEKKQIITETDYLIMVEYIRAMHGLIPKREKAKDKFTKNILIEEDRKKNELNETKPFNSRLYPLISAMLLYPGFKYKRNELKDCGIYEFMDAVKRSQMFVSSNALIHGMCGGMIDGSKINKKDYDWMRDI